ncbi:MAG: hypothetical protein JST92_01470 [Deltaproteobacteria bacterium]|nr:hypothetical protein [Deltaproteobacteria bacterium]
MDNNTATLLDTLLPSANARQALLRLVVHERVQDSISGLARRANLSQHATYAEVEHLLRGGLVRVEHIGPVKRVSANEAHPAMRSLRALLRVADTQAPAVDDGDRVRESLAAHGAPLLSYRPVAHLTVEQALLRGLVHARSDLGLLKVLPLVVLANESKLRWSALKEDARRAGLQAELGMLVELTADAARRPELKERVLDLFDRRRTKVRFFVPPANKYERALALDATPPGARRWGFLMNLSAETFEATVRKHHGQVRA